MSHEKPRPAIPSINHNLNTTTEEVFQNQVIRPIIKMKSDLLLAFFDAHLKRKKIDLSVLSKDQIRTQITAICQKDKAFREMIKGMVIGHFTTEELATYHTMFKNINKRIIGIIHERINSFKLPQ